MQRNRRRFGRQALNYPARIVVSDGSPDRECRLVDVSDGGARLVTEEPLNLPAAFVLALSNSIERRCELKWTDECEVGVLFVR